MRWITQVLYYWPLYLSFVNHQNNPQNKIKVYALVDEQWDACFVTETAINSLGVDGPDTRL